MNIAESISASIFQHIPFVNDVVVSSDKLSKFNKVINRIKGYQEIFEAVDLDFDKAVLMESGIFEFTLIYSTTNNLDEEFIESVYENKCREMTRLLKESEIRNDVMNGTIDIQTVPLMHYTKYNENKWKPVISKIELKEYKRHNIASTDVYKCGKCKERKCKVIQMQTRGADEMTSNIVTCLVCGHGWTC